MEQVIPITLEVTKVTGIIFVGVMDMNMFASRIVVVDGVFPNPNMKNVAALIRMMNTRTNPKTLDIAIIIVASTFKTIIHVKANKPPGTVLAAAVKNRAHPSPDGTRIYGIIAVGRVASNASVLSIVNIAGSPVSDSVLTIVITSATGNEETITLFNTHFRLHTNQTEDNQIRVETNRYGTIFSERSIP